jgi:hypothetical protein
MAVAASAAADRFDNSKNDLSPQDNVRINPPVLVDCAGRGSAKSTPAFAD